MSDLSKNSFCHKRCLMYKKDLQEEAGDTHSTMTHDPSSFYEQV